MNLKAIFINQYAVVFKDSKQFHFVIRLPNKCKTINYYTKNNKIKKLRKRAIIKSLINYLKAKGE